MKIKFTVLFFLLAATVVGIYYLANPSASKHYLLFAEAGESDGGEGDANARSKWELMRLADPSTGTIPYNIRARELAFAATLPKLDNSSGSRAMTPVFSPRGPWNVGGRTRAIAIDVTNENVIFAGSVNGGLWRSTDGGQTWTRVSRESQIPAVSCIIQDTRPGHTNTWYYGTGELVGTSASATGAFYLGNGIYKSTDGGLTWDSLPATYSKTPQQPVNTFDLITSLAMDYSDTTHDVIYASTVFYGIYKSMDGGSTWTQDLQSNYSYYSDVKVSATGIVYASESSDGANKGMWRKQNGVWAKISPASWDTTTFNRYVIGINPSNENEVYFLGAVAPNHGKETKTYLNDYEWNSLWKYAYLSGNGSDTGGLWQDLSQNLPTDTTSKSMGNFYTQGGYDLSINVDPDSSNIVYIGATNLYRSKDGFSTPDNISIIGGYDSAYKQPFYQLYPNHHPDQHNIAFLPSDHKVMIQSNDGGVFKTLDARADSVKWQNLDNGYKTAQFYTVALDHGNTPNDILIGGLQDNGSYFTNNSTLTRPWAMPGAGDGSYCFVPDGHPIYYFSRQQGSVAKVQLDTGGQVTAFRRIDPIDGLKRDDYLFVNPFVIDPNNNNAMFMSAGNHVWRNDRLDTLVLNNQWDSISSGWFQFPDTVASGVVASLAMSKSPAGRLYYGTSKGQIYRVDNPYSSTPTVKNITGAKFPGNFPATGYLNCIAVDPTDANKVVTVFTNYGIYGMFYTTQGDTPWVRVEGNLKPSDGSDISLRWASIIPVSSGTVYLAGTSIGLFGTNTLDSAAKNHWVQLDPYGIGNMVVDMIDYRTSDGMVVVATHGGGVYSAVIDDILGITDGVATNTKPPVTIYPNPAGVKAYMSIKMLKTDMLKITLYDAKGSVARIIMQGKLDEGEHELTIERGNLPTGMYFVNIRGNTINETQKIIFRN